MQGPPDLDDTEPTAFHTLKGLVSEDELFALLEAFGGTRVKVPVRARENAPIARVISFPSYQKLVAEYKGCLVKVPLEKYWQIVVLRRAGKSYSAIARRLKMDESNVYKALAVLGLVNRTVVSDVKAATVETTIIKQVRRT